MSAEAPRIPTQQPEKAPQEPNMKSLDELKIGDSVILNGRTDTIVSQIRSSAGVSFRLKSGEFLNYDFEDGEEKVQVT